MDVRNTCEIIVLHANSEKNVYHVQWAIKKKKKFGEILCDENVSETSHA